MRKRIDIDWSKIVAHHDVKWEDGPDGGAVLLVPRFRRGPFAKWLQPRLKNKFIRVKLDDIGSFVWLSIDGRTSFDTIAAKMKERFGAKAEPAEQRLKTFLTILYKDKFIQLFAPK